MKRITRVFLLTPAELRVYHLHQARAYEAFAFEDSASGHAAFTRYLADHRHTPAALLLDRMEEEFRTDNVPHVWLGRKALLARHSARLYPRAPMRSALVLGRGVDGRHDDRVLFSAIGRHEAVAPWLGCLADTGTPLAAINSIPFLSAMLLPFLQTKGSLILGTLTPESGLRQTVFINGELRFSRLAPLAHAHGDGMHAAMNEEHARTVHYLRHTDLIAEGTDLPFHFIMGSAAATSPFPAGAHVHALDHVAQLLRCSEYAARDVHVFFAELFARRAENRYATPAERRHHHQHRVARMLRVGSWWTAFGALLATGQNVVSASQARDAADVLHARTTAIEALPPGDERKLARAETVRAAVSAAEQILSQRYSHRPMLEQAGGVLEQFPEFHLDTLVFADTDTPDKLDTGADSPLAIGNYRALLIRGRMASLFPDRRRAGRRFDELIAAMEKLPGAARVKVIEHPFNVQESITGPERDDVDGAPRFGILLTMVAP